MSQLRPVKIAGTGMYVPEHVVTNDDLAKIMDTSDEWIRQRSGIETRYHIRGEEGSSDLAVQSSKRALEAAGLAASDIDMVIVATLSPDHQFPGTAAILQAKLGMDTTPSMDLKCQCSGFLYSLSVAKSLIATGGYERILVVGAEVHSTVVDMSTPGRDVSVLFGDGSGAAVLTTSDSGSSIGEISLHSQGEMADKLWLPKPGTAGGNWINDEDIAERRNYPQMEGRQVFKHAVTRLNEVVNETLEKNKLSIDDIDHFLFHQANLRINEKVGSMMNIPAEKIHNNIMKYGNCSAASIPMLLDECVRSEKINRGDKVLMAAFGAGFTWAAGVMTW